jgi:acetoin utilization deacetylase AcuC-like enzyme
MTLLYTDPLFLKHDTGPHCECPDRLRSIAARLEATGLTPKCTPGVYQPVTEDQVTQLHTPTLVRKARELAQHGGGHLDPDTVVCPDSYSVALAAAGACVSAVDAVVQGSDKTALCLIRPPGHHATPTRSMGFCLFNNIALAAHHACTAHGLTRILIADWDVHHGNGTQDIFYEDPQVMFFSIHRFGMRFYPGTGNIDETGQGRGLGYTLNVPVRYGTSRKEHVDRFYSGLEKAAAKIKPELMLLSAGFDAHVQDPLGQMALETEDFAAMTQRVLDVARTHAQGRLVSCLEGGYNLEALAESLQAHLEPLLAASQHSP